MLRLFFVTSLIRRAMLGNVVMFSVVLNVYYMRMSFDIYFA